MRRSLIITLFSWIFRPIKIPKQKSQPMMVLLTAFFSNGHLVDIFACGLKQVVLKEYKIEYRVRSVFKAVS